jgi:TrmH family RNA methyltransferase
VALPDIQHPGNLGTISRTCDAIGGDGVVLSGRTTDPYHPIAVRGTLGSIFSQRIVKARPAELARWLRSGRHLVVGTSPAGDRDYREVDYASRPVVLLMGGERVGLSKEQMALCDALVRIPMAGYVESLNLSVAAALVLYEVYRQVEGRSQPAG